MFNPNDLNEQIIASVLLGVCLVGLFLLREKQSAEAVLVKYVLYVCGIFAASFLMLMIIFNFR